MITLGQPHRLPVFAKTSYNSAFPWVYAGAAGTQ